MTSTNLLSPDTIAAAADSLRALAAVVAEHADAHLTPQPDVLESLQRYHAVLGDYIDDLCANGGNC